MSDLPPSVAKPHRAAHRSAAPKIKPTGAFTPGALKALDIVGFNAEAETYFVSWLINAINTDITKSKPTRWIISNAAYELDISTETVKRYLSKHTADKAEFMSDGKIVKIKNPKTLK